jgi:hypothetical protein
MFALSIRFGARRAGFFQLLPFLTLPTGREVPPTGGGVTDRTLNRDQLCPKMANAFEPLFGGSSKRLEAVVVEHGRDDKETVRYTLGLARSGS